MRCTTTTYQLDAVLYQYVTPLRVERNLVLSVKIIAGAVIFVVYDGEKITPISGDGQVWRFPSGTILERSPLTDLLATLHAELMANNAAALFEGGC